MKTAMGLAMGLVLALAAVAWAEGEPASAGNDVWTGPLPREWKTEWTNDTLASEALIAGLNGDCEPLRHFLAHDFGLDGHFRALVEFEMHDRGICASPDPEAGFRAVHRPDLRSYHFLRQIVGWKYWYGHGVTQDRAKAREIFKLHVIDQAMLGPEYRSTQLITDFHGRTLPKPVEDGWAWVSEQLRHRSKTLELGRNLLSGAGTYYDGTALPQNRETAGFLLYSLKDDPEALYEFFVNCRDGSCVLTPDYFTLTKSAKFGYVPAMVHLAYAFEFGDPGQLPQSYIDALFWYRSASTHGVDTSQDIQRVSQCLKSSTFSVVLDWINALRKENPCK